MKKLRKIIILFIFIFITGILASVVIIRCSLSKNNTEQTLVFQKEIRYLVKKGSAI